MNYKILFLLLLPVFACCSEKKDDVEVVHVVRITPDMLPAFLEGLRTNGRLSRTRRMKSVSSQSIDSSLDQLTDIVYVESGDDKK